MIEQIDITNFKSINHLKVDLGRINIFIGENGAGKSNILEAIALGAAASRRKLDNEFLTSRGIRLSRPELMRAAFSSRTIADPVIISTTSSEKSTARYEINHDNMPYSAWHTDSNLKFTERKLPGTVSEFLPFFSAYLEELEDPREKLALIESFSQQLAPAVKLRNKKKGVGKSIEITLNLHDDVASRVHESQGLLGDFVIYSPENNGLRQYEKDGQLEPLGINGEGLLRFLSFLSSAVDVSAITDIKEALHIFSWFDDFRLSEEDNHRRMDIKDVFLDEKLSTFDQRSANEGFLFAAFYFSLFSSHITPRFFAIDNIDISLNPKLCQILIQKLVDLAKKNSKQAIFTTHNPAVLDGIDLNDDDQRLFIVSRSLDGETRIRRFSKKPNSPTSTRLSELFLRGALGGLPKSF